MTITILPINCSLKPNGDFSTDVLLNLIIKELSQRRAETALIVRVSGPRVKPGVSSDEGEGDDWPALKQKITEADILLFGTPIWMGQPLSVAKRVLERIDAFLSETDDQGRTPVYGKLPQLRSAAKKMACFMSQQSWARLSPMWALPSLQAGWAIGSARRWEKWSSKIWPKCRTR